jgi:glycosyltransferase involved in cell wall biosynthesis
LSNAKLAVRAAASSDLFGAGLGARILPCGIAAEQFLRASGVKESKRFTLVHAGRLVPEKNHEHLLHLTLELRRREASTQLWLIGDGPMRVQLQQRIEELGLKEAVTLWGARRDVADLMASADVFVFPSHAEGLGLAAVEAQAVGLPVLAAAHLPSEMEWLPGAVHRLALDVPIEKWADTAMALRAYPPLPSAVREECLAQSKFSMRSNIEALQEIYAG